MSVIEQIGYSIIVKNVSQQELKKYQEWLENETPWSGNMGYTLYPSKKENTVTMMIDSGFSGTWYREIYPALIEYWGEERILNEVTFDEGDK